jgi:RNA polymerase sigma-70 factor (ECF subfamily)
MQCAVSENEQQGRFERLVLPHIDAAYNLARWLAGNDHDAEDIAQDACVRAFRFVDGCRGADGRAWLLTIVRNTAYSWLKKNRSFAPISMDDDEFTEIEDQSAANRTFHGADTDALRAALEALPPEFREILILRELEGFSYKEIADVAELPVGTVMSRLARARRQLQESVKGKELS